MKKLIAVALIALLAVASSMTALAHCHNAPNHKTALCPVRTCKKTSVHKHSGKTYRAHHKNDGHRYHKNHH